MSQTRIPSTSTEGTANTTSDGNAEVFSVRSTSVSTNDSHTTSEEPHPVFPEPKQQTHPWSTLKSWVTQGLLEDLHHESIIQHGGRYSHCTWRVEVTVISKDFGSISAVDSDCTIREARKFAAETVIKELLSRASASPHISTHSPLTLPPSPLPQQVSRRSSFKTPDSHLALLRELAAQRGVWGANITFASIELGFTNDSKTDLSGFGLALTGSHFIWPHPQIYCRYVCAKDKEENGSEYKSPFIFGETKTVQSGSLPKLVTSVLQQVACAGPLVVVGRECDGWATWLGELHTTTNVTTCDIIFADEALRAPRGRATFDDVLGTLNIEHGELGHPGNDAMYKLYAFLEMMAVVHADQYVEMDKVWCF